MIIDAKRASYLQAAVKAVEEGSVPDVYLTATCTECGEEQYYDDGSHVLLVQTGPEDLPQSDGFIVLIGCEGYLLLNPNWFGIDAPNWQDWTVEDEGTKLMRPITIKGYND